MVGPVVDPFFLVLVMMMLMFFLLVFLFPWLSFLVLFVPAIDIAAIGVAGDVDLAVLGILLVTVVIVVVGWWLCCGGGCCCCCQWSACSL